MFLKAWGVGDRGRAPQHTDVAGASSLKMDTRTSMTSPRSTWVSQTQTGVSLV